jgi:YbgC/YbaW family acyl-CoA thioester hydrolase
MQKQYSWFSSNFRVRPDDVDLNQHVHTSKSLDYVLAARYEQMESCYKFPMEEFVARGLVWYQTKASIEYKRGLGLGEYYQVKTRVKAFLSKGVEVEFEIYSNKTNKLCCNGTMEYTIINAATGRSTDLPEDIIPYYDI